MPINRCKTTVLTLYAVRTSKLGRNRTVVCWLSSKKHGLGRLKLELVGTEPTSPCRGTKQIVSDCGARNRSKDWIQVCIVCGDCQLRVEWLKRIALRLQA